MTNPRGRAPTVLLASQDRQFMVWLRDLLEPNGIALAYAETRVDAQRQVRSTEPDLIIVEAELPTALALETCRQLRQVPWVGPHTPMLLVTAVAAGRAERLAALRGGAWDVLGRPLDPQETLLKINAYARAKLVTDAAVAEALVDPETGLYNVHGLGRLARELGAIAARAHTGLACLVVVAEPPERQRTAPRCVRALKSVARASDVIGRLGAADFALLAPVTDLAGARQLAERLERALAALSPEPGEPALVLRIGYDAVDNMAYASINAMELLGRANLATRRTRPGEQRAIVGYGDALTTR
ncbi:MAG TPA: response regulator [Gemmatimonadales bacterium]|nr:response regulator [Gemmatimonadales bacterium]